jgi:hypothetical protein
LDSLQGLVGKSFFNLMPDMLTVLVKLQALLHNPFRATVTAHVKAFESQGKIDLCTAQGRLVGRGACDDSLKGSNSLWVIT